MTKNYSQKCRKESGEYIISLIRALFTVRMATDRLFNFSTVKGKTNPMGIDQL